MRRRSPAPGAGLSLVEVLLASALLLVVVLGVLPMFFRAIQNNVSGNESTLAANYGKSEIETYQQLQFNNWQVRVLAGTEQLLDAYLDEGQAPPGDETWIPGPPPTGVAVPWRRATRLRQFQINGVQDSDGDGVLDTVIGLQDTDGDGEFDNLIPAGAPSGTIHLKEVVVSLQNRRQTGTLGAATDLVIREVKSF